MGAVIPVGFDLRVPRVRVRVSHFIPSGMLYPYRSVSGLLQVPNMIVNIIKLNVGVRSPAAQPSLNEIIHDN